MSDDAVKDLDEFFYSRWGDRQGQVYLATLEKGGDFKQYMLEWPKMRQKIAPFLTAQAAAGRDAYYCPSLFLPREQAVDTNYKGASSATRANIQGSQYLWVDFDSGQGPDDWTSFATQHNIPEPTEVIQSSVKGNQHVYWRLEEFNTSIEEIESVNRALAFSLGADRSGWDGNQLLRPPGLPNYGYKGDGSHKTWYSGSPANTRFLRVSGPGSYNAAHFDTLRSAEREAASRLPDDGNYPSLEEVLAKCKWSEELYTQFSMTKDEASASSPDKRSGAIMRLAYLGAESGFSDEQLYTLLSEADIRWEKYHNRSPAVRHKLLTDMIVRARSKIGYVTEENLTFAGLLNSGTSEVTTEKYIYRWDEFLASEIEIEWLIEGLLSSTGYGVLTGQPGVGKTQAGLQLVIALALGQKDYLGWNIAGGPHKSIMFSLEMGHAPLKKFASTIQTAYPGMEREIGKNLSIVPLGTAINILSSEGYNFIDNVLSEHRPELVFIDSLKKIMTKSLSDEEGIRQMNDVLAVLRKKHNCAFVVIHHDRKKQNGGKQTESGELSDMYGSQYIAAEADFALSFRKSGEQDVVLLDSWKIRLAAEPPTKVLRREHLQYVWDEDAGINGLQASITRYIGGSGNAMGQDPKQDPDTFGFEGRMGQAPGS